MAYSSGSGSAQFRRISHSPRYLKRLFPLFAAGFLVATLLAYSLFEDGEWESLLGVSVMVSLLMFLVGRGIWSLADEVHDAGSFLLVRRGEIEQKIYLNDIESIDHESVFAPPGIRITCQTPGALGRKIRFLGDDFETMLSTPPLVRELRERVDRVRGTDA